MEPDTLPVVEQGLLTLSADVWELASRRARFIAPLTALEPIGRQAANDAAEQLGVSRRQVYLLSRRYRQAKGLVTDLAPGQSSGGKGKRRLSEAVERIISDLIHKHFLTRQKCSLAMLYRRIVQTCKAQGLPVPARNTVALRIAN